MFITEEMACQPEIGLALCNVVTFISIAIKNGEIIKPNTFCKINVVHITCYACERKLRILCPDEGAFGTINLKP